MPVDCGSVHFTRWQMARIAFNGTRDGGSSLAYAVLAAAVLFHRGPITVRVTARMDAS